MADVEGNRPPNVVPLPRWTVIIHAVQILFAIIVLGLSAYGVHYIAYNALIYALVVCICTFGVSLYIVATSLFMHKLYNKFIVMAFSVWMIIFWIVDLGLVANLARIWSGDHCGYYYDYYNYSYYNVCAFKRDLSLAKRDSTTLTAYYGALCAGAFFAAMEFVSWVATLILVVLYMNKQNQASASAPQHAPPAYVPDAQNPGAVPMEKYNYTQGGPQQQQPQQQPQQPYPQAPSPAPQPAVPVQHQGQYVQPPQPPYPQYPQDPISRGDTVSPVSQPGGYVNPHHNASELVSPQQTGPSYNPNVSELSTNTAQHTGPSYNPNVSELSTNTADPNMPELADKK